MTRTLNFLAPSLHPGTLVDISFADAGPSRLPREPIVRNLAIKHGEYPPISLVKRMIIGEEDQVCVLRPCFYYTI